MKNAILTVLLLINMIFIVNHLIYFDFRYNQLWMVILGLFFISSMVISVIFLYQSRKRINAQFYFSATVLSLSIGAFGWYLFLNYLFIVMG
ncbi:hypothetical protein [Alkalibacillus aidingensis]|uniref:hypothetical protein n=1 Tax=Alkalibacillus aidingensis TaxID=2747607 RepID=UPI001660A68D|nr:hypothetical protein [Alkalibacillus aidingensis]